MEKFELLKRVTDSKVVKLRQEFDISLLLKSIEKKADKKDMDKQIHDIDSKISQIESLTQSMEADFGLI